MEKNLFVGNGNKLVVSEFVSNGHPDKIADQIADAILDEFLKNDENVRAGIEVMVKDNIVVLGGEINSRATIDYEKVVRSIFAILDFPNNHHLAPEDIKIVNLIGKQSEEIHGGVDATEETAAGDQGFMVGYASNETDTYMPLGHYLAKKICNYVVSHVMFGPDAKTQVIIEYDDKNDAVSIHSILVSTMHQTSLDIVRETIKYHINENFVGIDKEIYEKFIAYKDIKIDVNPCGSWQIGGPVSDCGVTGRKLVVDAYGGYCNIGGGNASGKDLSKVDRSGAYMARYLAKNIVASGFCDRCRVTLSYMIGVAQPCSVEIDVNRNKEKVPELKKWINENIKLTPKNFIEMFCHPNCHQFFRTSMWGHYGFDVENNKVFEEIYPWERLNLVDDIKKTILI